MPHFRIRFDNVNGYDVHPHKLRFEVDDLHGTPFIEVLRPMSQEFSATKFDALLGLDSEYQDDLLLSVQFSRGRGDAECYILEKPWLTIKDFERLLKDYTGLSGGKIYLIVFFGSAEARFIENFTKNFTFLEIGRSLHWKGKVGAFDVIVKDLYSFLKGGLGSVGKSVGLEKVSLEGLDGKSESWWKCRMRLLLKKHRKIFIEYAKRDAEICVEGWNQLQDSYLKKSVDILQTHTITATALQDFRRNFLQEPAAPCRRMSLDKKNVFVKSLGEWRERSVSKVKFNGNWDVRAMACLSYWAAPSVAYWRGYRKTSEPFARFLDVASLYVVSGILTPLPNWNTDWEPLTDLSQVGNREGFAEVRFRFPDSEPYPSLACKDENTRLLCFPLQGETYETLSQIRQAVRFGASVQLLRGWGFVPTEREKNHDLGKFLREVFELKSQSVRGSLEYQTNKLLGISLIGKFYETRKGFKLQEMINAYQKSPKGFRKERFKIPEEVAASFAPEWASLDLGKARSLMSGIVRVGHCMHLSTDGGIFPEEYIDDLMKSPEVKELESVGSGLMPESSKDNPEGLVDEAIVVRTRKYATWFQGQSVHAAAHAVHVSKKVFEEMMRKCIDAKSPIVTNYEAVRLAGVRDVFLEGKAKRLLDEIHYSQRSRYWWDCKRKIPLSAETFQNPFIVDEWSNPMRDLEEVAVWRKIVKSEDLSPTEQVSILLRGPSLKEVKRLRAGRPSKEERKTRVTELIKKYRSQDKSYREIAKILKIPRQTIHDYEHRKSSDT